MKKQFLLYASAAIFLIALFTLSGCGKKNNLSVMTQQELFDYGKTHFDNKKYTKAINAFQTLVYNYPGADIIDTAQYYLSLSYFSNKEYELAQVEFNRLAVNYPSSVYFTQALFMKAVCYFEGTPKHYGLDQSDLKQAIKLFEDFIVDYPESELVKDAQAYIAKAKAREAHKAFDSGIVYERLGAYKSAEIYFQLVLDDYTDSEYADDASFKLAYMKYKRKLYNEAETKFKDFTVVFQDSEFIPEANKLAMESAYKYAESLYKKKDFADAKAQFERFISEYPTSDKLDDAKKHLAEIPKTVVQDNESEQQES